MPTSGYWISSPNLDQDPHSTIEILILIMTQSLGTILGFQRHNLVLLLELPQVRKVEKKR